MWSTAKSRRERGWPVGKRRSRVARSRPPSEALLRRLRMPPPARDAGAFSRHELRRPRKEKTPEAWLDLRSPATSRYAVGLAIPRPVARLQSRTPIRQAHKL